MPTPIHISHLKLLVENVGPESSEQLMEEIRDAIKEASETCRSVVLGGHAGPYDILVHPAGTFCLIPTLQMKHYKLIENNPLCVEECN